MTQLPFFTNSECPYFPCHEGVEASEFNCLFCFCPLYTLGSECGGDFIYLENGVKSCERCLRPHCGNDGNNLVSEHFPTLANMAADSAR